MSGRCERIPIVAESFDLALRISAEGLYADCPPHSYDPHVACASPRYLDAVAGLRPRATSGAWLPSTSRLFSVRRTAGNFDRNIRAGGNLLARRTTGFYGKDPKRANWLKIGRETR